MRRPEKLLAAITKGLPWLEVTLAAAAVAVTAPLYAGCFAGHAFLLPVLLAAPVGAALAALIVRRTFNRPTGFLVAILGCLVYLLVAVLFPTFSSGRPTGATWTALRDGVIGGWLRMLTSGAPMDVTPTLLMTPVLVTFCCGGLAASLCLRTRRPLLPMAPALVALVVALLFGATWLKPSLPLAALWLLLVLFTALLRSNRFAATGQYISREAALAVGLDLAAQQRRNLSGRLALGAPVVVLVVLIGVGGTALLPIAGGQHRFDLRTVVAQPIAVQQTLSPLATIQSQLLTTSAETLFTVSGLNTRVDRLRVAVLDTFDGATWSAPHERFLPAGHQLPPDPLTPSGTSVTIKVTEATTGRSQFLPFLPVAGSPTGLVGENLGYSAQGVLVTGQAAHQPFSYAVTGMLPAAAPPATAVVAAPPDLQTYLTLPKPLPKALVDLAHNFTKGQSSPFAQAQALANNLQKLPYDAGASPGHSYGAITRTLASADPTRRTGFAEQYASAFVVLARILGIPARVAVGYLVDPKSVAAGKAVAITTHNAHAWAEIPVVGYGWVPVETVDLTKLTTRIELRKQQVVSILGDQGGPAVPIPAGGQSTTNVSAARAVSATGVLVRRLGVGAGIVIALLLLPAALIVGEKRRRRWRRRTAPSASGRILGAWREARDRLVERGIVATDSASSQEIAASAARVIGDPARTSLALAPLVATALFAPEDPGSILADEAWSLERQLGRDLARSTGWTGRVRARLDPRPLVRWQWPHRFGRRRWGIG